MFAIHVPTVIRRVAAPMSWAVAITSLLTSAAKTASNPASSASRAIAQISCALHPTPGMTASPSRSAITPLLCVDPLLVHRGRQPHLLRQAPALQQRGIQGHLDPQRLASRQRIAEARATSRTDRSPPGQLERTAHMTPAAPA